jgi:hypothetical protein
VRNRLLWSFTLIAGCPGPGPTFIAPLDGQTGVPLNAPLQLRVERLGNPQGYPLPEELIRVVDLESGGFVPGRLVARGPDVLFVPIDPWRPGASYAWVVSQPAHRARQPELRVPPEVLGEAVFHTASGPALLEAVLDDGELCLLLSEPADALPWATITVGGEPLDLGPPTVVDPLRDIPELELLDEDPGAGALCFAAPAGVARRDVLRGGGEAVEIRERSLLDAVAARYRLEGW